MINLYKGYVRTNGKIPVDKFKKGQKLLSFENVKNCDSYAGVLADDVVLIDVDDSTQAEILMNIVEDLQLDCFVYQTKRGKHFLFKNNKVDKCGTGKKLACGLTADIKVGKNNSIEALKVNGEERFCEWDCENLAELPKWLLPINSKIDLFGMTEGDGRDSALYSYILTLTATGFSKEESKECLKIINKYILAEPLTDDDIERITRDDAFPQEVFYDGKTFLFHNFAEYIKNEIGLITLNNQLYAYKNGVYKRINDGNYLNFVIKKANPNITKKMADEVIFDLKSTTYFEAQEEGNYINVKNGLLKLNEMLKKVEIIPHYKEYISFRQFSAEYIPDITSEFLENTLNKFFDSDKELIRLFKQMLGYLLMNNCDYQKAFFFVGVPSSGKSKILNMIQAFCGKENVSNLSLLELDDRFRASSIVGKIANINGDLDKAKISNSGVFKQIVTGDAITIEEKYNKPYSHAPTLKLLYASNQLPNFSKDSEGIHRRLIIFPCNHSFSKTDADFDPKIDYKLSSPQTLSALLNMAIEGYFDLIENDGFINTTATQITAEQFELETDNVLMWIEEIEITSEELLRNDIKDWYYKYKSYCVESGQEAKEQKDFTKSICRKYNFGSIPKRINGERCRCFIKK